MKITLFDGKEGRITVEGRGGCFLLDSRLMRQASADDQLTSYFDGVESTLLAMVSAGVIQENDPKLPQIQKAIQTAIDAGANYYT